MIVVGTPKVAQVISDPKYITACASLETPKFKDKDHSVACQGEFAKLEKNHPVIAL
jgi:hypothetical protein